MGQERIIIEIQFKVFYAVDMNHRYPIDKPIFIEIKTFVFICLHLFSIFF